MSGTCTGTYQVFSDPLGSVNVMSSRKYPSMEFTSLGGYTVSGITISSPSDIAATYYDDHSFIQAVAPSQSVGLAFTQVQGYSSPKKKKKKGIPTGNMESVLGNPSDNAYIYTASYADAMGRTVQETSTSHLAGRMTRESVNYDFAGRATKRRVSHISSGGAMDETYSYTFDGGFCINTYDFGARTYIPDLGRFTTMDPMAHKRYGVSPYVYCGGDPVNFVDPDGKFAFVPILVKAALGVVVDLGTQMAFYMATGANFEDAFRQVDWTSVGASAFMGPVSALNKGKNIAIAAVNVLDVGLDYSFSEGLGMIGNGKKKL